MPIQPGQVSALRCHHVDGIREFLSAELNRGSVDAEGNSALHLVCMPKMVLKHSEMAIRLVVDSGFGINARNNFGSTPLMLAALLLPPDLVKVVIAGVTNDDSVEDPLNEALLLAALYGRPDVVSELISGGAKIVDHSSHGAYTLRIDQLNRHKCLLQKIDTLLGVFPDFDREIAQQRDLDGSDLVRLALSTDTATKQYVALNPNTPSETLLKLAPEFPRAFYKNPAFDWLLLENPDLLFEMKQGVLKHILTLRDCPESILLWAARNGADSEKLAVVRRIDVSNELLQIVISGTPCKAGTIAIAKSRSSSQEQLEGICGKDVAADRLLAVHSNASASLLAKLAESSDEVVRDRVLAHKNTSPVTLRELSSGHIRTHRLK